MQFCNLKEKLGGGIGAGTGLWDADRDTGVQVEEGADDDIIRFDTLGIERMVILANGKVGIGTSTPDYALTLEGLVATRRDIHLVSYSDATIAAIQPRLIMSKSHSDTSGTKTDTIDEESLAHILFRGVDNTQAFDVGAKIEAVQDGAVGARVPTNLIFTTWGDTNENVNHLFLHHDGMVFINDIVNTKALGPSLTINGAGQDGEHLL